MKIDFTVVLKDQDNKPLKDVLTMQANGNVDTELTLGRAAVHALMYQGQDEPNLGGEEKFSRGLLAFKIRDDSDCELKAEDIALIKKLIGKLFSPIVVYRAYPILDGVSDVRE